MNSIMKKAILSVLSFSLVASSVSAITISIQTKNLNKTQDKRYYQFDGQNFANLEQIKTYALNKSEQIDYYYQDSKYLLDNKIFSDFFELENYINQNFKISSLKTIYDPNVHVINGNGELNPLVANLQKDQLIRVYQGQNDKAFLTSNEALKTYQSYQKAYEIAGHVRYNETDAMRVLKDVLQKEMEDVNNQPQKKVVYPFGATFRTEEEIKKWLYSKLNFGFEYKNHVYSEFNSEQFKKELIDETIFNQHIKQIPNANYKSYWLQDYLTNNGYYMGPKYIQTPEDLPVSPDFKLIDSYDQGLFMSIITGASMGTFLSITNNIAFERQSTVPFDWRIKNQVKEDIPILRFLDFLFLEQFIDRKLYDEVKKEFLNFQENNLLNILSKATIGFEKIPNLEFGNIQKMLVALKRILTNVRLIDEEINKTINFKNLNQIFGKLAYQVLSTNNDVFIDSLEYMFGEAITNSRFDDLETFFDLETLFDLYLDPERFIQGDKFGLLKAIDLVRKWEENIDHKMAIIGAGASLGKDVKEIATLKNNNQIGKTYLVDEKNTAELTEENLMDDINALNEELNIQIEKNQEQLFTSWGIKERQNKTFVKTEPYLVFTILAIIAGVWSLQKLLGFISWKTFEFKIDKNQVGYYFMPTYKIPLLNIPVGKQQPNVQITKLLDGVLNYFPDGQDQAFNNSVWEFNDKYYLTKEQAKEAMFKEIQRTPENYLPAKKVLSSIIENDGWHYLTNLDQYKVVDYEEDINPANKNEISRKQYQELVETEKNKYVETLFDKYYKVNSKTYFLDGFGGGFNTPQQAINSMYEKLKDKKFIYKYEYTKPNFEKIYFETLRELEEYVANNQVIDSKWILKSQLMKSSNYSELEESKEAEYTIYVLDFYGEKKYFGTELGAQRFLMNNLKYQSLFEDQMLKIYYFGKEIFYSQMDFFRWINQKTKLLDKDEMINKEN